MKKLRFASVVFLGMACLLPSDSRSQTTTTPRHKLEPVAETKLIMDGLAKVNLRGLERLLSENPQDDQAWRFARGQALLLAETGNLLMLRPPKAQGVETWFDRASELRTQATALGQALAVKDLAKSRNLLTQVAGSCNRCHQSFRVPVQIDVTFPKEPMQKVQKVSLSHP